MAYVAGRAHCVSHVSYMEVRTDNQDEVRRWLAAAGRRAFLDDRHHPPRGLIITGGDAGEDLAPWHSVVVDGRDMVCCLTPAGFQHEFTVATPAGFHDSQPAADEGHADQPHP